MDRERDRDRLRTAFAPEDLFGIHPVHIDDIGIVGAYLMAEEKRLLLFSGRVVCSIDCTTMDRRMEALDVGHITILRKAGA